MPIFDWWGNRGQVGSLTESRTPDCLSLSFSFNIHLPLWGAVLSPHSHVGFSLTAASGGYSPVVGHGLLIAVASLVANTDSRVYGLQQLQCMGSAAPRHMGSSWTRDQTVSDGLAPDNPSIGIWILNHWTTREVPRSFHLTKCFSRKRKKTTFLGVNNNCISLEKTQVQFEIHLCRSKNTMNEIWLWFLIGSLPKHLSFWKHLSESAPGSQILIFSLIVISTSLDWEEICY